MFKNNIPQGMKSSVLEDFAICMKEDYKINRDAIASYRNYYKKDKVRFAKWKLNNVPIWF